MARTYEIQSPSRRPQRIDFAAELNPQQLAAVTSPPGQALVIAGAGSGKTRTLTYRVAYLLDNGIRAENILLLTFTNKAAREMIERVQALVPHDVARLWSGTFHSIGNRILRYHAEHIGFRKGFTIMDREDQKSLMDTVINASKLDTNSLKLPKADVLIEIASLSTNTVSTVRETLHKRFPHFETVIPEIEELLADYQQRKQENNSMDFDDLLARPVQLLQEQASVREHFRRQFQFVLVDEFQDTNQLQLDLISMLVGPEGNLMVVGDDAQSIYSWRGADVENMLHFNQLYPDAGTHKIEINYRSVPEILALANAVIENNTQQIPKVLTADKPSKAVLPGLIRLADPEAQAAFVGQRIGELIEQGVCPSEIAILYRAHFHSLDLQLDLSSRSIPFKITSGLRFFEQAHIKDVAAFMKLLVNRQDEVSFHRIARLVPGIGPAAAMRMWDHWKASPAGQTDLSKAALHSALHGMKVPKKSQQTWEQFAYTMEELLVADGEPAHPAAMIQSLLLGVYEEYMRSKFQNYEQRQQDLEQLAAFSDRYDDIVDFLTQLALLTGVDTDQKPDSDAEEDGPSVTLTTAHQAKGLEWNHVFAIWLTDGMFPNKRAVESGGEEEERRLFYVTVTRAKEELYLCYPESWFQARDGSYYQVPSRFLQEIDPALMETWNVKSRW